MGQEIVPCHLLDTGSDHRYGTNQAVWAVERRNVQSRSLHSLHSETVWGLESSKPRFLEEP